MHGPFSFPHTPIPHTMNLATVAAQDDGGVLPPPDIVVSGERVPSIRSKASGSIKAASFRLKSTALTLTGFVGAMSRRKDGLASPTQTRFQDVTMGETMPYAPLLGSHCDEQS